MMRVLAEDGQTNVAVLRVSCDECASSIVQNGRGLRYRMSPIAGTERTCEWCNAAPDGV